MVIRRWSKKEKRIRFDSSSLYKSFNAPIWKLLTKRIQLSSNSQNATAQQSLLDCAVTSLEDRCHSQEQKQKNNPMSERLELRVSFPLRLLGCIFRTSCTDNRNGNFPNPVQSMRLKLLYSVAKTWNQSIPTDYDTPSPQTPLFLPPQHQDIK